MRDTDPFVKLQGNWIVRRLALNGQLFSGCNFDMELPGDFLRDIGLDGKQVVQIAIILLGPNVSIRACVDQLRV